MDSDAPMEGWIKAAVEQRKRAERAEAQVQRLQGELADAGKYTEAHERLDDWARERVAAAEAQVESLTGVLRDVRAAIMEHAPDTLWVSLIETAVDCIDAALASSTPERKEDPVAILENVREEIRDEVAYAIELASVQAEESSDQAEQLKELRHRAEIAEAAAAAMAEQRDDARALLEWRPIETAPHDGTHIILAFGQDTVAEGWWEDNGDARPWKFVDTGLLGAPFNNGEGINGCRDGRYGPTHWQPLPTPPKA